MVPMTGVEPALPKKPPPQGGVSTNFTTSACITLFYLYGQTGVLPVFRFYA